MTAEELSRSGTPILQERGLFWWADKPLPAAQFALGSSVFGELKIGSDGRITLDLNVVLGFQQSHDVVEFYRRFRGR